MWDRGLRVRNISFYNFPSPNTQAIFGPVIAGRCVVFCGGMRKTHQWIIHLFITIRLDHQIFSTFF